MWMENILKEISKMDTSNMSQEEVVKLFFKISKEAEYVANSMLYVETEPIFEKILKLVLDRPEMKEQFIEAFISMAHKPELGPYELIQFCMHELRWQEVKNHMSKWLESEGSERAKYIISLILWSFDENWDGALFYKRFNKNLPDHN